MEAYLRSSWILISTIYHLCLRCCAGGHREPARHSHQPDRAVRSCPRGVEVPPLTLIASPWAVETGTRDHGRGPFWAPPMPAQRGQHMPGDAESAAGWAACHHDDHVGPSAGPPGPSATRL